MSTNDARPPAASGGLGAVAEAKFDDWMLKAKLTLALRTLRVVEHYLPAIEAHHSPASGLTGRQAAERILVTISELSHAALAAPAATGGVAWRWRPKDGTNWVTGPYEPSNTCGCLVVEPLFTHPAPSETGASLGVKLPRLTEAMMRAACKSHFGDDNIDGISMTVAGTDWTFRLAFKRMWSGIRAALEGRSDA